MGVGSGAHSGPGFLPWHREYLKRLVSLRVMDNGVFRFELALRMVDPLVFIPYWDSVMDSYLPDPRDSIMFSNLFAGETDLYGNVIQVSPFTGPSNLFPGSVCLLADSRGTRHHPPPARIRGIAVQRTAGQRHRLPEQHRRHHGLHGPRGRSVSSLPSNQFLGCPYPNNYGAVEYIHSNIHLWIGGDMKPPSTSANEVAIFLCLVKLF